MAPDNAPNTFHEINNPADIEYSKPIKSRFLFLLGFFGFFVFAWTGCYSLSTHGYKSNKDVEVQKSTLYNPEYK